ncbi:bifunctional precorrin-2 dehydrogenase/sirohydrochlorin ferrochelatase [Lentilactobacillus hilgardii]|nr:bifunctional precorrin-2 dehydrogenase/sirohydrochlorin ferrochelatase [Lentilactobacillus hilgardii]
MQCINWRNGILDNPYPVILNLATKSVAVIGGGHVAARKIKSLLSAGASVTVISPDLSSQIDKKAVCWVKRAYLYGDITDMDIVIACTDDPVVNQQVTADATHFQLVNNASNKGQSDFFNVAEVENNHFLFTVSTKGQSPAMAKTIKKKLAAWLESQEWFRKE